MNLVDTHQHLWDLRQFPCSWCAGVPALNRNFLLADYVRAAAGLGITKTVFMECDVDEPHALDEARAIQRLAASEPLIAGIVAGGRPEHADFPAHLEKLAELPQVRGVRRVLHTQPDGLSAGGLFVENIRRLAQFGFTFDLCALPRQLPAARALAEACPGVSFVLDHCGIPDVKGGALDPWRDEVARLARLPNVACKVSGLVAYADPAGWTTAQLRPWVDHVLEHFGWDRVAWGGDWPVCTLSATLRRWVETLRELVAGATAAQRELLFHRNAERIYHV